MSLKQWDRKIKALQAEVTFLASLQQESHDRSEEKIHAWQEKLPALQMRLEKRLSYIQSLAQRNKFLSSSEKAVLHWAQSYAQKAQAHYKEYLQSLLEVFWAQLVHLRGASLTSRASDYFTKTVRTKAAPPSDEPNNHQKQLQQIRTALKQRSQQLQKRKAALERRYLTLGLIKANRDATWQTQLLAGHTHVIQEACKVQRQKAGLNVAAAQGDNNKLATLSTPLLAAKPQETLTYDPLEQAQKVQTLLNSFDFMQLEDELNRFDGKGPKVEFTATL